MSGETNFLILLDALRHDYVSQEATPFLASLKEHGTSAKVIETFAFQTRPAYFAGLEPEESGICHLFEFNPRESPFAGLRPLIPLLAPLARGPGEQVARSLLRRIAKRVERLRGHHAAAAVMSTARIPLQLLPLFALAEKTFTDAPSAFAPHRSVFDEFSSRGFSWNWIGYPRHFGSTESILRTYAESPKRDVVYLHFSELDWLGHRYGPDSAEIRRALSQMDSMLRSILEHALQRGARAVVFGDHGMVEVQRRIDLEQRLAALPLRLGVDYVVFLDSTQARFWFLEEGARAPIESLLRTLPEGHILSAEEQSRLRIRFKDNRYGDLIFMLDGGTIIHPSYFDREGQGPAGMHGYLPEVDANATQVIAVGSEVPTRDLGTIPMTALYDVILDTVCGTRRLSS